MQKGGSFVQDDVVVCVPQHYYYTHHDRHSCPIQKLRVIAQASLHSAHDGVMLDKPQDYLWKIDEYYFKSQSLQDLTMTRIPRLAILNNTPK